MRTLHRLCCNRVAGAPRIYPKSTAMDGSVLGIDSNEQSYLGCVRKNLTFLPFHPKIFQDGNTVVDKKTRKMVHDPKKQQPMQPSRTVRQFLDRDILGHISLCAFYIGCNFVWFWTPMMVLGSLGYGPFLSYSESSSSSSRSIIQTICTIIVGFQILDVIVPMKDQSQPPYHGHWPTFCQWTDNTKGIYKYNNLDVIVEDDECDGTDDDDDDDHTDGSSDKKNDSDADGTTKSKIKSSKSYYRNDKNYLFCYFPHALYPAGLFPLRKYYQERYGMTMLFTGADILFHVPILRRLMTWWGMTHVSKHAVTRHLTQSTYPHNLLMISPDGIQGMFYGLDKEQIVLQKRKGFCKVALRTGASLVPCYMMGANQLYDRYWGCTSLAFYISHWTHMSLVYWTDRFRIPFGFIPKPIKMIIFVGRPIDIPNPIENPTPEQISDLHTEFISRLRTLFEKYKYRMGHEWVINRGDKLYLEDESIPKKIQ